MKPVALMVALLAGLVGGVLGVKLFAPAGGEAAKKETAYERVMRMGVIRCGYYLFDPTSRVNKDTGKLEGIAIEAMEKMAENANLKVDWAEEVSFGQMVEGLKTGRYDAMCTPAWPDGLKAREVEFIVPTFYAALGVWVRPDDTRFDADVGRINAPDVTISGIDGQIEGVVHKDTFPKAKFFSMPQSTDYALSLLNVATRKADVTFVDVVAGNQYNRNHPENPLKNVAARKPLRIFPFSLMVNAGEYRLKNLLDVSSQALLNSGYMGQILDKYDPRRELYRAAPPVALDPAPAP